MSDVMEASSPAETSIEKPACAPLNVNASFSSEPNGSQTPGTGQSEDTARTDTSGEELHGALLTPAQPPRPPRVETPEEETFSAQLDHQIRTEERMRAQRVEVAGERVPIKDLLRQPGLAARAWQEMAEADEHVNASLASTPMRGGEAAAMTGPVSAISTPCAGERMGRYAVYRDRSLLDALLSEADEEFELNTKISKLLVERLAAGRAALRSLHQFVTTLADAESAAVSVLTAHAPPALHQCEGDPLPLHQVAAVTTGLPIALSEPRRAAATRLAGAASEIHVAEGEFTSAGDSLERACDSMTAKSNKQRYELARAMAHHEANCAEADRIDDLQRQGIPIGMLDADPWVTHAAVAAAEHELLISQRTQRSVVMGANEQVERLERKRMTCWQRLVAALLQTYGDPNSGIPMQGACTPLQQLRDFKEAIAWDSLTEAMVRSMEQSKTNASISDRKDEETLASLERDLFTSSEIVRQGNLERYDIAAAKWVTFHVVLTQRGNLHFCRSATIKRCEPLDSVALRVLDFDGVAGRTFGMVRQQSVFEWLSGRSNKVVLRAEDETVASQWIVDIKDQIARWTHRDVPSPVRQAASPYEICA